MNRFVPSDDALRQMFEATHTIAVVGLSANPARPSHSVSRYLHRRGFAIVPINPTLDDLWGLRAYASVVAAVAAGHDIDMVDVFRRPDALGPVVDDAIAAGARFLWLQEGVVNDDEAARAEAAGLQVVMDRCTYKEHARLVR